LIYPFSFPTLYLINSWKVVGVVERIPENCGGKRPNKLKKEQNI